MSLQLLRAPTTYLKHGSSHSMVHPCGSGTTTAGGVDSNARILGQDAEPDEQTHGTGAIRCAMCPACVLPLVVAFIIVFTVVQLIIIHRTIESYKERDQAFRDSHLPHAQHQHLRVDHQVQFQHPVHQLGDGGRRGAENPTQVEPAMPLSLPLSLSVASSHEDYEDSLEDEYEYLYMLLKKKRKNVASRT